MVEKFSSLKHIATLLCQYIGCNWLDESKASHCFILVAKGEINVVNAAEMRSPDISIVRFVEIIFHLVLASRNYFVSSLNCTKMNIVKIKTYTIHSFFSLKNK